MATGKPLPAWRRVYGVVAAGGEADFDILPFDDVAGIEYQLTILNATENKYLGMKVHANREDSEISYNVSDKIGDPLSKTVQVLKVGSDAVLRVSNGEAFPLTVSGIRAKRSVL